MPADAIAGSLWVCRSWQSMSGPVIRLSWTSDSVASASPPPPQYKDTHYYSYIGKRIIRFSVIQYISNFFDILKHLRVFFFKLKCAYGNKNLHRLKLLSFFFLKLAIKSKEFKCLNTNKRLTLLVSCLCFTLNSKNSWCIIFSWRDILYIF